MSVWVRYLLTPRAVLVNDFTVPGAAIKQGRRQEPCTNPDRHPRAANRNSYAFLPPSSFGQRFGRANSKSFLDVSSFRLSQMRKSIQLRTCNCLARSISKWMNTDRLAGLWRERWFTQSAQS